MPLTFNPGETKTFQLQAEGYKAYPRHWVGREFKVCSGAGCALCAAGVTVKQDYMIPIAIAGIQDSWAFGQTISQQLDLLGQQGYKLLGLMIRVTRTGSGRDTRYQVSLAGAAIPGATVIETKQGLIPIKETLQAILPQVSIDAQSYNTASRWVELGYNLLAKKEFMEMVAKEVQRLKDEGLWA